MGKKKKPERRPADGLEDGTDWWGSFNRRRTDWHELFLLAVALMPLVYYPSALDLYDLPKRACLNLIVLLFTTVHLFEGVRSGRGLTVSCGPVTWPALAYLGCLAVSSAGAVNTADALDAVLQQGTPVVLMLLLITRGVPSRMAERFLSTAILAGLAATALGLAHHAGADTDWLGIRQVIPPASVFGNKNMAAEYVLMTLPMLLYRLESSGFRTGWWLAVTTVLGFLFLGQTKAVWIGAAVVLFLAAARWLSRPKVRTALLAARAPAAAGLVALLAVVNLTALTGTGGAGGIETLASAAKATGYSANVRLALWANSWPMLLDHPMLGVGPGNWYIHYPLYSSAVMVDPTFSTASQAEHPHNDLVQIAGEVGILGLAAFLWLLAAIVREGWTLLRHEDESCEDRGRSYFICVCLVAILVDGVFAYPMHLAPGGGTFFALSAMLVSSLPAPWRPPVRRLGGNVLSIVLALFAMILVARELRIVQSNVHYRRAAVALASQDAARAEAAVREAIERDPHRYRTHSVLGRTLFMARRVDEAIQEYRRALEFHPNQINVLYNLAHALKTRGSVEEAVSQLRRAIGVVPRFVEGHYLLGTYLKESKQLEEALKVFQRLLQISPDYADGYNELGNVSKDLRRYAEAEKAYLKALELDPKYGQVHNNLGVVYLEQGRLEEAIFRFHESIELSSDYPGTYFNLGRALTSQGKTQAAVDAYERFLELWRGDPGTAAMARGEIARLKASLPAGGE